MKPILALAIAFICGHAAAQTVINTGGTYQYQFYYSPDRLVPAVLVTTYEPVVFQNTTFYSNTCVIANPGADITFINCTLYGGYYKKKALVVAPVPHNLSFQNCLCFSSSGNIVFQSEP